MSQERFVRVNGVDLAYQQMGHTRAPAVLLIMGLGGQLLSWPLDFCQTIVDAGFQVIRFDNRDAGLSTKFSANGKPNLLQLTAANVLRRPLRVPYRLSDMARDATGLLSALDISQAHVVGVSMGGMIAQLMALDHSERVASLTALMSSSGNPALPGPSLSLKLRMIRRRSRDPEATLQDSMRSIRLIGSPAYPRSDAELEETLRPQIERAVCPDGVVRQIAAIIASGSRAHRLHEIKTPTLVIHGDADPLLPVAAAYELAEGIPGALRDIIEGLGHDFPAAVLPRIADSVCNHLRAVESRHMAA